MKALVILIPIAAVILASCASQPLYSPASRAEGPGYSETRLTDSRYRVSFVGRSSTSSDQVQNYALLRAAELTLQNGNDWFQVVDRSTREQSDNTEPRVSIGVGSGCHPWGCRSIHPRWYSSVFVDTRRHPDRYHTSMEIIMGNGKPDNPDKVYNASELKEYLQDKPSVKARD